MEISVDGDHGIKLSEHLLINTVEKRRSWLAHRHYPKELLLCTVQVLMEPMVGYRGKNAIYLAVINLTFSVTH